jgi:NAD(P)-dependent dehydrogenase (short-subunit alcohol dehydrogenase family)
MRTTFDAAGEVLVVTGGANGIGAALAHAYTAAGGTSVLLDVVQPSWPTGDRMSWRQVDVADRGAVAEAIAAVQAVHDRVDALVCAAAVQPRTDVVDMLPDEWIRTLNVNLNGVVWASQAVLPGMIARRSGSIIAFSSGLAASGRAQAAAYAASKGAVASYVKSLAAEVARHRVRVNVIYPGVVDTHQFRAANPGSEYEHWRQTTGVGEPEDVAGPLMFLLSDAATMTGSVLSRDRAYPHA